MAERSQQRRRTQLPETASGDGSRAQVTRWEREDPPDEHELYARMEAEGLSPYLRGEPPGTRKPMHRHPFVEILWVLSGWVRYTLQSEGGATLPQIILKAGDRIEIPPELKHETEVEGSAYLVYLTNSPYTLGIAPHPQGINI